MQVGIHPEMRVAQVSCSGCGSSFVLSSSASELTVESCSHCHPAYTGRGAKTSSGSMIERFERRLARSLPAQPAAR